MANSNLHHDEYILLQVAHGRLKQELATQRLGFRKEYEKSAKFNSTMKKTQTTLCQRSTNYVCTVTQFRMHRRLSSPHQAAQVRRGMSVSSSACVRRWSGGRVVSVVVSVITLSAPSIRNMAVWFRHI